MKFRIFVFAFYRFCNFFFLLLLFCLMRNKVRTNSLCMYACTMYVPYIHVHTHMKMATLSDRPSLSAGHKFPDLAQRRKVSSGIM